MASRNQYTYTPGYGTNNRGARPGGAQGNAPGPASAPYGTNPYGASPQYGATPYGAGPVAQRSAQRGPAPRTAGDTLVLALVFIAVPLCGVLGIFVPAFLWVFILAALAALVGMLALRCFTPAGRTTISVILVTLMTGTLVLLINPINTQQGGQNYGDPTYNAQGSDGSGGLPGPTAPIGNLLAASGTVPDAQTGDAVPDAAPTNAAPAYLNEAETVMHNFMQMWRDSNYEGMVQYVLPSWRASHEVPHRQLSWNHQGWELVNWEITREPQAPSDDAATLKVSANLLKATPDKPKFFAEYDALLFNVDGVWYVDPNSMRGNPKESDGMQTAAPPTSTTGPDGTEVLNAQNPTTKPTLKLWYNPDGGSYYHTDAKCPDINEKYYSQMKAFEYGQMKTITSLSKLTPCKTCNAPQ